MTDLKTELDKLLAAASAPNAPVVENPPSSLMPVSPMPAPPVMLRSITTKAEFDLALANAPGPVAVLFTQEGCDYCEDDKKELMAMAEKCAGSLTALEVDLSAADAPLDELADTFKVNGTPTLLFAEKGETVAAGGAKEVDTAQLKRKLKCARPSRSSGR